METSSIAAVRLSSLRREDGSLMPALPVTIVSIERQVRFESAFGRLASGPLSALYVPAGFRLSMDERERSDGVFALCIVGATASRDLLPARVPIDDAVFAALAACERDVPWVRDATDDTRLAVVRDWLCRAAVQLRERCRGRLVSRQALRWIGEVTASEDALIAAPAVARRDVPLPPVLAGKAQARRFCRVTGYGPRHYAREYHRRVTL